ncbi:MAG TPA: response regulator [Thermoguttaceae bacterium]|nr:response regulator [Thermoguttaceae bacterium]
MNAEPTVFIIDDDQAVRHAVRVLVESMRLRTEAYGSAEEFLADYDSDKPGCILLDVRMPGISGLEIFQRLSREELHPPVIFLSAHGDVPMVVEVMRAGALNFLEKPCRDQQLWEALREALQRDAENRRRLAQRRKIRRRIDRLNSGEREVMTRLVAGESNKTMAASLGLSVRTIEVRRAKVMQKMKAGSLAELVRLTLLVENPVENHESALATPVKSEGSRHDDVS